MTCPATGRSTSGRRRAGVRAAAFLEIDEPTLQGVANITGGQYFRAQDADQLDGVFQRRCRARSCSQHRQEELTVWFVLVASLLAAARDRPVAVVEPLPVSGAVPFVEAKVAATPAVRGQAVARDGKVHVPSRTSGRGR